jgi:chemotaxis protein methyltransferase CheR
MTGGKTIEAVVDHVADLLHDQIGLRPEPTLRGRLLRCIRDGAAASEEDLETYLDTLAAREDVFQNLLNRVTVQETSFFRHPEHFTVLARDILPVLPEPVTIWSAGCANGQEAFSLAMLLNESGVTGNVLATDLSTAALQRTMTARYSTRELTGLSSARVARHLNRIRDSWEITQAVRDRVVALRHNLLDPLPNPARSCQVIFCRNVLIYLAPQHARRFLDRLADTLPSGISLFLGSAESIWPISERFDTIRVDDTFVYRRRQAVKEPQAGIVRDTVAATSPAVPSHPPSRPRRPPPDGNAAVQAALVARAGQEAATGGDHHSAVVAFRKWVYLTPDDAIAHLHLGLALEAAGDHSSARRAFNAARNAVLQTDASYVENSLEGYAKGELLRLLDTRSRCHIHDHNGEL